MDDKKEADADAVRVGFVKDCLYGAVTLLLFASFGWPQWSLAATHVLSVPPVFFGGSTGTVFTVYSLMATLIVTMTDVVTLLTLTCGMSNCCASGARAPAFAPTMPVCDPSTAGSQSRVLSAVALVTVAVGVFISAGRALAIEKDAASGDWLALAAVYGAARVYQLTWALYASLPIPAVIWSITFVCVGGVAFTEFTGARRKAKEHQPRRAADMTLYAVASVDIVLILAPLGSTVVPDTLKSAFYIMQSLVAVIAVWQAHRYWAVATPPEEEPPAEEAGDGGATDKKGFRGLRHRAMCL